MLRTPANQGIRSVCRRSRFLNEPTKATRTDRRSSFPLRGAQRGFRECGQVEVWIFRFRKIVGSLYLAVSLRTGCDLRFKTKPVGTRVQHMLCLIENVGGGSTPKQPLMEERQQAKNYGNRRERQQWESNCAGEKLWRDGYNVVEFLPLRVGLDDFCSCALTQTPCQGADSLPRLSSGALHADKEILSVDPAIIDICALLGGVLRLLQSASCAPEGAPSAKNYSSYHLRY